MSGILFIGERKIYNNGNTKTVTLPQNVQKILIENNMNIEKCKIHFDMENYKMEIFFEKNV